VNCITGGIVSVLALIAVDRGFEPKTCKIGICYFSAKHAALKKRAKTGWLGIRIMCPSIATGKSVGLVQSLVLLLYIGVSYEVKG